MDSKYLSLNGFLACPKEASTRGRAAEKAGTRLDDIAVAHLPRVPFFSTISPSDGQKR